MVYNYIKIKAEDANANSFEKLTLLDDVFMKICAKGRTIEELKVYLRKISAMFKEQDFMYMTDENDWHEDYYVPPKENVMALTNVSEKRALDILETTVKEGYFGKNGENDYYLRPKELTKLN